MRCDPALEPMESEMLFLNSRSSRIRAREAEKARQNRLEIVKALSLGEITKRDLFKWGVFTAAGYLANKNGLSPFARSAFAAVPTGTPRSPLLGATKFSQPMPRAIVQPRIPLLRNSIGDAAWVGYNTELPACGRSYHTDYDNSGGALYRNPVTQRGRVKGVRRVTTLRISDGTNTIQRLAISCLSDK
jgi:hypothetical protein